MATFKDLNFKVPDSSGVRQAIMDFHNGYKLSVLCGGYTYSELRNGYIYDKENRFEVAILKNERIDYDNELTNNEGVIGYQTPEDINKIISKLEQPVTLANNV
jgi:hypothetical protein